MSTIAKLEAEIIRRACAHADREAAGVTGTDYNDAHSAAFFAESARLKTELLTPEQQADLTIRSQHTADLSSAAVESGGWRA
jgi:hypothetical protein